MIDYPITFAATEPGLKIDLAFTVEKSDDLDEAETSLKTTLYVLRKALDYTTIDPDWSVAAPVVKQLQNGLRAAKVTRKGDTLHTSVRVTLSAAERLTLAATLRQQVANQRAINNLKLIGLALHSYHDSVGHFQAAHTKNGKPGKALLSWRVAILPYLEEDNLYRQFKLDEAWDSDHNKKLLAKMPKIYAPPPGVKTKEPHSTFFQVFTGPNTPFPTLDHKCRMVSFLDGTSNTFLVAEAGEAVPWTKPVDMVIDPKMPLPKLGGHLEKHFLALFADGSVRRLRKDLDAKWLRLLIDPQDNQKIDWEKIEGK